jgi:glycosyltransferase involved in cell wall biosynthesis
MTSGPSQHGGRRRRVLVMCGAFEPGFRGGGPIRSVANIVDTAPADVDIWLVTSDRDLGSRKPYPGLSGTSVRRGRARVFYVNTRRPAHWLRLWRELRTAPFDLLYVNSLFEPVFTVLPIVASRMHLIRAEAILVAPRGELSAGALSLKALKKRLFLIYWGRLLRHSAVLWHASADLEAREIRAVFPWADVEVTPNLVALSDEPIRVPEVHDGPMRLVFIGRISPMKNLTFALEALRTLSHPADFDIYGPVEDRRYWSRCRAIINRMPTNVRVRFHGELRHDEVRSTFACYDAFVFPTRGENFGHVIAESLSASCPVICSDQTPWTEVLTAGGGVVVPMMTATDLGAVLDRYAAMQPDERLRAREAAGAAYRSWRKATSGTNVLDRARFAALSGRR